MSLYNKELDSITEADLSSLIQNCVREGRNIEYKEILPGNSDDDKREFLADLSSFANAGGGDLIYGIKEKRDLHGATTGEPETIIPLSANLDAASLRLHEMAQGGIDPRISGLRVKSVPIRAGGIVILVRVPRSWAGLHMVTYKNLSRFYSRNSSGKYQLDAQEIRSGFVAADTGHQRLTSFRLERVTKVSANEGPVFLAEGPNIILHIIPMSALDPGIAWDLSRIYKEDSLRPIGSSGWSRRYNFDGILSHISYSGEAASSYAQLFRNGTIEAYTGEFFIPENKLIASQVFEREIIRATNAYLNIIKSISIPAPLIFFLSLTGVAGYNMALPPSYFRHTPTPIKDGVLLSSAISIDSFDQPIDQLLQPVFDRVWNAAGGEGSIYYNDKGNWVGNK
jgi:Putative DNA-binding domain